MSLNFLQQSLYPPAKFEQQTIELSQGIQIKHHGIGIIEVIPLKAYRAMVISCGIHGNETAPIELVDALLTDIIEGRLIPSSRLLFIIAHPKAILLAKRFMVENLNRLFVSDKTLTKEQLKKIVNSGLYNIEQKIAAKLQFTMKDFYQSIPLKTEVWHLDLHSAIRSSLHAKFAVIPTSLSITNQKKLVNFCQQARIKAVLFNDTASHSFSWWSGKFFGVIAATIELGQVKALYQNDLTKYRDFNMAMSRLIDNKDPVSTDKAQCVIEYQVSRTLYRHKADFAFSFADDMPNFTFFPKGKLIAVENGIKIKSKGEAVVFPNPKVAIGQRAALLIKEK